MPSRKPKSTAHVRDVHFSNRREVRTLVSIFIAGTRTTFERVNERSAVAEIVPELIRLVRHQRGVITTYEKDAVDLRALELGLPIRWVIAEVRGICELARGELDVAEVVRHAKSGQAGLGERDVDECERLLGRDIEQRGG